MYQMWKNKNRIGFFPTRRISIFVQPINNKAMPPEGHYERRRAEQDRIINDYLKFMKKQEREAKKEIATMENTRALGMNFTINLN